MISFNGEGASSNYPFHLKVAQNKSLIENNQGKPISLFVLMFQFDF